MPLRGKLTGRFLVVVALLIAAAADARSLTRATFDSALRDAIPRVRGLTEVADRARALGLRVWLSGGAAATITSVVRRHALAHPNKPANLELDELFHSAQDIDLAVDGPEDAFEKFATWLEQRPPFLSDGRSAWEPRQLRRPTGLKGPLLGDPDFLAQHSDTQSTGVAALFVPDGEPVLRDLADWDANEAPFVVDARLGRIRFRYGLSHGETPRAFAGLNPPFFAAVRYWTKVLALGLETNTDDERRVAAIIDAFDPETELGTPYARNWLERNGKKLLLYARDLESARKQLERTGLAQKLDASSRRWRAALAQKSAGEEVERTTRTLAEWLDREPLAGFDVGSGEGPTAAERGLDLVAHETADFAAWEILMRSPENAPNVFTSRPNREDENARYGAGFYVRTGSAGARDTGFTVRFRLRPEAREGTDFERAATVLARNGKVAKGAEKDFIVVKNRKALVLVREDSTQDALGFVRAVSQGQFTRHDGGLIERHVRRLAAGKAVDLAIEEAMRDTALGRHVNAEVFTNAWVRLPWATRYPEVVDVALARHHVDLPLAEYTAPALPTWIRTVLTAPQWVSLPDSVERFRTVLASPCSPLQYLEEIAEILGSATWRHRPEWVSLVRTAIEKSRTGYRHRWLAKHVFIHDRWLEEPEAGELILALITRAGGDPDVVDYVVGDVLSRPGWERHPMAARIVVACFAATPLAQHPFLAERMSRHLFSRPEWQSAPSVRDFMPRGYITGGRMQHLWRERACHWALVD